MAIDVLVIDCPACGQPIRKGEPDLVFLCECGALHTRHDSDARELKHEVAVARQETGRSQELTLVPFWRLECQVTIRHLASKEGFLSRLARAASGAEVGQGGGATTVWVPAPEWDPASFKQWATWLSTDNPSLEYGGDLGTAKRLAVDIGRDEAVTLADFVILTIEAERPGVLQELDYEVAVNQVVLVYLPFATVNQRLSLAI
jgi:hypothetical protein